MQDAELAAMTAVVSALSSLDEAARKRVLQYAAQRYAATLEEPVNRQHDIRTQSKDARERNIYSFAQIKKPTKGLEMAAVVAYYLLDIAPDGEKRDYITSDDVPKYFRQAKFPLPEGPARFTLTNAKAAGLLESAGQGKYKLTGAGINFVERRLPKAPAAA